jgi:hypothetical protein
MLIVETNEKILERILLYDLNINYDSLKAEMKKLASEVKIPLVEEPVLLPIYYEEYEDEEEDDDD